MRHVDPPAPVPLEHGPAMSCTLLDENDAGPDFPDAPFRHGPFEVQPDGGLEALRPPHLRFAWRGRGCEAWLDGGRVRLSAHAGEVPYTAERPADRPAAIAALAGLPRDLPRGWRMRLLPDHRVRLEADVPMQAPPTAAGLVGTLVGFALRLDPYLDRLESAGVGAGGGAPGTAKT